MKITKLKLENFRGIRSMQLDFHPRLNVLVGINGAGKTSVLDALASSFSWWVACWRSREAPEKWRGQYLYESDINNDKNTTACSVWVDLEEKFEHASPSWTLKTKRKDAYSINYEQVFMSEDFRSLTDVVKKFQGQDHPDLHLPPPMIYYPISRTEYYFQNNRPIPKSTLDEILAGRVPALETLQRLFLNETPDNPNQTVFVPTIESRSRFDEFLEWMNELQKQENLKLRELQELGKDISDPASYQSAELITVKRAWAAMFSQAATGFIVKEKNHRLSLSLRKNGQEIFDNQLSGGEKAVLAIIGDLAKQFSYFSPDSSNPLEEHGVVLIDEIELHLHPQWQRTILSKLMEIFPNTQFIVTTHSPQVLGELKSENIILLKNTTEGIISKRIDDEVFGLTSNDILEAVMDTDDRTSSVARKLSDFYDAVARNEFDQAHEILDELKTTTDIPELEKLEMRLRRMILVR